MGMVEQSRGSLNAGYNHEIQHLLQKALIPAVEKGLLQSWGPDWVNKLDERRATVPDQTRRPGNRPGKPEVTSKREPLPPIGKEEDGTPRWDTNTLLHTIREYGREMSTVQRNRAGLLKDWCYELRDLRNGPSHADPETFQKVNSDRNLIYQSAIAIKLLKAFNANREAEELEALMDGPWAATLAGAVHRSQPKPENLLTDKPVERATLLDGPVEQLTSANNASGEIHTRRRTDLPAAGRGVCVFPLAGRNGALSDDRECLASANAGVLSGQPIPNFAVMTGDSGNSATFYQIIRDTRGSEPNNAMLDAKTRVRIDTTFIGNSFGLAVAIADRSARYGVAKKVANVRIVATGAILAKHEGEVEAIDHFLDKVAIVQHFRSLIPPGSLFIFPRKNLETDDKRIAVALKQLEESGIEHRAIAHINELNDLFPGILGGTEAVENPTPPPPSQSPVVQIEVKSSPEIIGVYTKQGVDSKLSRRSPVTRLGLAASIAFGMLGLGGMYYVADHLSGTELDVAAIQASDERLRALTRVADAMRPGAESATDCVSLLAASLKIVSYDLQRADDVQNQALDRAKQCGLLISESDARLQALRAAADDAQATNPLTVQRLADARAAITPFDEGRTDLADMQQQIDDGDRAALHVTESNRRIDTFNKTISSWQKNEADGQTANQAIMAYRDLQFFDLDHQGMISEEDIDAAKRLSGLVAQSDGRISQAIVYIAMLQKNKSDLVRHDAQNRIENLTTFDMARATESQIEAIVDGQRSLQNLRLKDFETAAAEYAEIPSPVNTLAIMEKYDALPLSDRLENVGQLAAYRPSLDRAQQDILSSDQRLLQLDHSYTNARSAEESNVGLASSYHSLAQSLRTLNELDKARLSTQQQEMIQYGTRIADELAASDHRLMTAITLSELAQKMPEGSDKQSLMEKIRATRSTLTNLDKDRMTAEQKQVLDSVCNASPRQPTPLLLSDFDTLPPVANLDCYEEKDFQPEMLPALR